MLVLLVSVLMSNMKNLPMPTLVIEHQSHTVESRNVSCKCFDATFKNKYGYAIIDSLLQKAISN